MIINLNFNWFFKILQNLYIIFYYIILLLITSVIVLIATKKINFGTIMIIILLYSLFLIIFNTLGNNILSISVSSTVNPVPPHTGLNGISVLNLFTGNNI